MGRGMYRVCVDPGAEERPVDVHLRDSVLDTGDRSIVPDGVPNPLRPSERVYWWQSPDVKMLPAAAPRDQLDGVEFDLDLPDDPPEPSRPAVVYLQIHNRGWETARDVHARVFYTAAAGLPHLTGPLKPPSFDPGPGSPWIAIGPTVHGPGVEPARPVIVSWQWQPPTSAGRSTRLLVVVSCEEDPFANPGTDIPTLVRSDKHVCVKAWTPPG